jgi:hypothetical protein
MATHADLLIQAALQAASVETEATCTPFPELLSALMSYVGTQLDTVVVVNTPEHILMHIEGRIYKCI